MKAKTDYKQLARQYYQLSKPGIIYGNLLTASAGFLYASSSGYSISLLLSLLVGLTLIIASACATNNYLDCNLDGHMERTKKRSLVIGSLPTRAALGYALITLLLGGAVMIMTQNMVTAIICLFAWFAYVVLYGYSKRYTVHGTLVGCISWSAPMVAGYTAVVGQLNITALLLFLLMTAWQMAHFYGIALRRQKDYANAGVPVMPVVYGAATTKLQATVYIVLFAAVIGYMFGSNRLGIVSALVLTAVAIVWLFKAIRTWRLTSELWGKKVFLFSLVVVLIMSAMLSLDPLLP